MIIHEEFYLDIPHAEAWKFFSDFPSPLAVMPGKVELTPLGDNKYRGGVRVHIGPFVFTFHGILGITLVDPATYRVNIKGTAYDKALGAHFSALAYTQTLPHGTNGTRVILEVHVGLGGLLGKFGAFVLKPKAHNVVQQYRQAVLKEILRRRALANQQLVTV